MRLALDPGKTTGVAWRSPDDDSFRVVQWPGEAIKAVLDGLHKNYVLDEVVIENFRSRPGPAVNLSASETIGRVEAWCDDHGVIMIRQEVGGVKRRVTDDRLRAKGGWIRGQQHARDAVKHLLYREEKVSGEDYWPKIKSN